MNREEIKRHLQMLGQELQKKEVTGQILLAEGVVMLLDVKKPEESKDINAYLAYLKGEGPPVERRKDIDVRFGKRGAAPAKKNVRACSGRWNWDRLHG